MSATATISTVLTPSLAPKCDLVHHDLISTLCDNSVIGRMIDSVNTKERQGRDHGAEVQIRVSGREMLIVSSIAPQMNLPTTNRRSLAAPGITPGLYHPPDWKDDIDEFHAGLEKKELGHTLTRAEFIDTGFMGPMKESVAQRMLPHHHHVTL